MIKIKTIKQFEFQGVPVILRQLNKFTFEYLLVLDKKFYGTFIKDKLKWYEYYKLFKKNPYTNKTLNVMISFLTKTAETTIMTLQDKDNNINNKNE